MRHVGVVLFPGFQILDLVVVSAFELANEIAPRPIYDIRLYSEEGGGVTSSSGVRVDTVAFDDAAFDTVMVTGTMNIAPSSPKLLGFLRVASTASRRIASICTGAYILAEAGLLDDRRATTHWAFARRLQEQFPKIKVMEDKIFIVDGKVWSSAGMTACIDLCLAMIENDLGVDVSRMVAKTLVVYHRRAGGQSQFSALLDLEPKTDRIQRALDFARKHLRHDLSVQALANAARLSPRQFSRAFRSETGQSPARAVETLRLEAARIMLDEGQHSIDAVAVETGFSDREHMRRAFLRAFGQPPQAIRRALKHAAAA